MQDDRAEDDGRERRPAPWGRAQVRGLLIDADEKQHENERKMEADFYAKDFARGNGPALHLLSVILYVGYKVCRLGP